MIFVARRVILELNEINIKEKTAIRHAPQLRKRWSQASEHFSLFFF